MRNPPKSEWERWPNLITVLFFLVLIGVFYREVLFGNSIFVFVDASRFFYPLWKWGAGVLNQGTIPLWNSDAQFGTPYFADPQMAYAYPPLLLLYFILGPLNAFATLIILHHFWALLGFWFFARGQGFSPKTSFLGSLIFGFSLHLVCSSWTPVALLTISWVPWVFRAGDKLYENQKGGFLSLSFAWAMQLAAGYPVITYLTGLAVGMNYFWRTLKEKRAGYSWLGSFTAAGLTAVAYNLVWGIPFAEILIRSNYQNGASRFHDLNWLDLGTALNPFLQGHPLESDYRGVYYWVSTFFMGLPVLCLLLWGGIHRVYRKASWGVFLLLLVLSLGILGLGKVLKVILPGYSLVIHSGYWISLLALWTAWMGMESVERIISPPRLQDSKNDKMIWIGIIFLVYGLTMALGQPWNSPPFGLSLVCLISVIFLKSSSVRWWVLLASTFLSLGSAATSLNISLDQSFYDKPPEVLSRLSAGGRLFFPPPVMAAAGLLKGESMAQAYETAKQNFYPDWPLGFGREEAPIYNTLRLSDPFAWTFQAFQRSLSHSRKVLDYLNIRYVFGKNEFKDFKPLNGFEKTGEVSENPTALPKWFTVEKADAASPSVEDDFIKADKESMDYGRSCFIADPGQAGLYQPRQVMERVRKPNLLTLGAEGKGKALLISSETNFPGWRVWVEGRPRSVETINHSFRGVVLEEGEKKVLFYFLPVTFRFGLFISLLIIALWTWLLAQRIKS